MFFRFLLLTLIVTIVNCAEDGGIDSEVAKKKTTTTPLTTITPETTTKSTTEMTTTPVTTSTISPNTTTAPPPTTTPTPPTTPPTPPTTPPTPPTTPPTPPPTTPPTTTPTPPTTAPPSTTPAPAPTTPAPAPETVWVVKDKEGHPCLMAKAGIHLDVTYPTTDNKTKVAKFDVWKNATVSGDCTNDTESFTLYWDGNVMSMFLTSDKKASSYWIKNITFAVPVNNQSFPNITGNLTALEMRRDGKDLVTPLGNSFSCRSELQFNLNVTRLNTTARLSLMDLKLEGFHSSNKTDFSAAFECEADKQTPDIVPIAVGCAIALLIIVVLIAYLVSRRRTQARGYLSM